MGSLVPDETVKYVLKLYHSVLTAHLDNQHPNNSLNKAMKEIKEVYNRIGKSGQTRRIPYEEITYRYAYIYYFGTVHTLSVINEVARMKESFSSVFVDMMRYDNKELDICSIGSGPGCDLLGLLIARQELYGSGKTKEVNCSSIDICPEWKHSVRIMFDKYTPYCGNNIKLEWNFVRSNVLGRLPPSVWQSVEKADILSLVKFLTVLPKYSIVPIFKRFFLCLKPGAHVFFLDSCLRDEHVEIREAAKQSGLTLVVPIKHQQLQFDKETLSPIGLPKLNLAPLKSTLITLGVWKREN